MGKGKKGRDLRCGRGEEGTGSAMERECMGRCSVERRWEESKETIELIFFIISDTWIILVNFRDA